MKWKRNTVVRTNVKDRAMNGIVNKGISIEAFSRVVSACFRFI